ncbi:MAG: hypothetical protein AAGH76_01540 [Pseudomonadota bacterium]
MTVRAEFDDIIDAAKGAMMTALEREGIKPETIYHVGVTHIDPQHLSTYLVFATTRESELALTRQDVLDQCFALLKGAGYPSGKRDGVNIGYVSIQHIEETTGGNWYLYFK